MMNLSELLTSIKMDLGIYGVNLPIEDADTKLYEVIKLKSLKTFSVYLPQVLTLQLRVSELEFLRRGYDHTIIRLPNVFGDRRIISIYNVRYDDYHRSVGYQTSPEIMGTMDLYQSHMLSSAVAHINSAIMPSMTFRFEEPNIIHLHNFNTIASELTVDVAMEHYDNLMSIPNAAFLSFQDLALLDVQIFLYNIIKHYNRLETPHGSIELNIDDWANAADRRRELVAEWKRTAHLNGPQFILS